MIFEVDKMYLTRDGSRVLIESNDRTTIKGTVLSSNGTTRMWYAGGKYRVFGESDMDLMIGEITGEKYLGFVTAPVGWKPTIKENAALFKQNLDLLEDINELQKENGRLHIELREARMIARGMVVAIKQSSLEGPPEK